MGRRQWGTSLAHCVSILLVVIGFTACGSKKLGFGVGLTLSFASDIDDATLATITTLEYATVDSDETYDHSVALGRSAHRTERELYLADANTRALMLVVSARDAGGVVRARGQSAVLELVPGKTTFATIVLDSTGTVDGGGSGKTLDFVTASTITTAAGPSALAVGDVDGNGTPDVVVCATTGGKVQVFSTDTSGVVSTQASFESTSVLAPSAIAIGDVNGDGNADLVVADSTADHIVSFAGTGKGTFAAPVAMFELAGVTSIAIGRFDADTKDDLVASGSGSSVVVWLQASATTSTVTTSAPVSHVYTPDLDHDALSDLAMVEKGQLETRLDVSTSPGTFAQSAVLSIQFVNGADFRDVNGDGAPEGIVFLAQSSGSGEGVFLSNNGSGVLSIGSNVEIAGQSNIVQGVLGDFDADGKPDVVALYVNPDQLTVAWGSSSSSFSFGAPDSVLLERTPAAVGVLDYMTSKSAHVVELVAANQQSSSLSVVSVKSGQELAGAPLFPVAPTVLMVGPRLYDFNDDGRLDIGFYRVYGQVGLSLAAGDGLGSFESSNLVHIVPQGTTGTATASAVGKLRANGTNTAPTDVVYASDANELVIALGTGPNEFAAATTQPLNGTGSRYYDLAIADVDGDGKQDVLVVDTSPDADTASENLVYFHGNGDGTLATANRYAAPGARQVLVTTVAGATRVLVLSAEGQLFPFAASGQALAAGAAQTLPVGHPNAMALLDVNGDGVLDLAVSGDTLDVLLGSADGTFGTATVLSTAATNGVVACELDGAAPLDLAAAGDSRVLAFTGTGTSLVAAGSFAAGAFTAGSLDRALLGGDLTGDGLADLVVRPYGVGILVNDSQ